MNQPLTKGQLTALGQLADIVPKLMDSFNTFEPKLESVKMEVSQKIDGVEHRLSPAIRVLDSDTVGVG